MEQQPDWGSFRDPGGHVYIAQDHVYRTVLKSKSAIYEACRKADIYNHFCDEGLLLPVQECSVEELSESHRSEDISYLLKHPRLDFISYPYEWTFAAHKSAALLHLDLHIALLETGFTLCDATAYNVQFLGTKPVFIDHLSIEPYNEGEIWSGHHQFCMQFLNPLIMWSKVGVAPNDWFRGSLEGIAPEALSKILPLWQKKSWTVFSHVVLQSLLKKKSIARGTANRVARNTTLSKNAFTAILLGLRNYIENLTGPKDKTVWEQYDQHNTYVDQDIQRKEAFVAQSVQEIKPGLLYDLGCNTGRYSDVALNAGAKRVIGFDYDHAALGFAFERFSKKDAAFTPLYFDAANPSPNQGWGQKERKGFEGRAKPDAIIALAFIHHIVIGRNIPLDRAVHWLLSLAPAGVIEFPDKTDPMVQELLRHRKDIFPDYNEANFIDILSQKSSITAKIKLSGNNRLLVSYSRQ
ncbi:MAG: class I SAM-dependent methyltransferase [Rhodospirillales bacterium]|nr:class I SAM-dependent methyltransferase [Rhodospirillales bacterium]MBT5353408.1 class I SAM-dependent methyltransferase [Rhodospirillales bacterium]MBT5519212.1 class I SAM-dependent methyltransferase [Rhodospirillales bacterium]MBT6111584.1 class I SAM-dependent methyltransferase [Rhodospirillales bacterium]MBT7147761.1 class I SAM-dependent methyltransferase [Rhodospirillales bacterium]